jgi:hypothetical protein
MAQEEDSNIKWCSSFVCVNAYLLRKSQQRNLEGLSGEPSNPLEAKL